MRRRLGLVLLLLAASLVAVASTQAAPLAAKDAVTIPPGSPDPWSDPNHHTPFEQLASSIASSIVGRPVTAKCEDQATWTSLNLHGDSSEVLGFVREAPHSTTSVVVNYRVVWAYHIVHHKRVRYRKKVPYTTTVTHADTFTQSADTVELSPAVCGPLQQFAEASTKPTKCTPVGPAVPCFVGTPTTNYPGICTDSTLSVCYSTAIGWGNDFYDTYDGYAQALLTLAHESIHVIQNTAGNVVPADSLIESQAECSGMQWLPQVAVQLGDSQDDAQAIAEYLWLLDYPGAKSLSDPYSIQRPYWSADCTPGGPLDIRPPGSTVWP